MRGTTGVIESPNFPDNYDTGDYCEWRIELPKVKIIFHVVLSVMK